MDTDEGKEVVINDKINPTEFDVTMHALLVGLDAEKYVEIFRKNNIGQCTLMELTDEDLTKLGVDEPSVRQKLLEEVKNLPIYNECGNVTLLPNLGPIEIVDILEESSQHLYRVYLSVLANTLAVKKTKKISDCILYKEKYASDIALSTLSEITTILNSMDVALHTNFKALNQERGKSRSKKILIGAMGSAVVAVLTALFVKSLKDIN
ncbi:PREDICTED: uncharacterized protein LOC106109229 [Papilio polytes]|uniref:uncharacterized protein LOC106109229 n=1 Tax=Papilio polytes TaxID=76194 RepID=UPI0006764F72|nr:PREDICTED: uncharacterized protein LOC106109229 [Papilio polytes]